jgi:hypothetical protein
MKDNDNLKLVFTGTVVEASFLKSLLEENGIGALLRDTLNESILAGWASGAPGDAGLLFVAERHVDEATRLIDEYHNSKI